MLSSLTDLYLYKFHVRMIRMYPSSDEAEFGPFLMDQKRPDILIDLLEAPTHGPDVVARKKSEKKKAKPKKGANAASQMQQVMLDQFSSCSHGGEDTEGNTRKPTMALVCMWSLFRVLSNANSFSGSFARRFAK